jgi:hypothetical protein
MLIQGQVGQPSQSSISAGANPTLRQGQLGELIINELHGRYYETTYRRNMFTAALTSGTTTSAALSTTFTGFLLLNPNNSSVNFVINKIGMSFLVAFTAAAAIGIQTGNQNTAALSGLTTTNTQIRSNFVGQPATSVGLTYSAATTTAPALQMLFGAGLTGAITTTPQIPGFAVDIEGSLIIPPGAWIGTYTSTASGASGTLATITYEEVPI